MASFKWFNHHWELHKKYVTERKSPSFSLFRISLLLFQVKAMQILPGVIASPVTGCYANPRMYLLQCQVHGVKEA